MAHYQELARQQKTVEGELVLAALPRLHEALQALGVTEATAFDGMRVHYRLQGLPSRYFGEVALPMVALSLKTTLPLVCQRCFEPMPEALDLAFEFALCDEPPESLLEDEEVDWLESADEPALEVLVEDELLMALPIAVMHEGACAQFQQSAGERPNPFAVLKQLKLDK